MTRTSRSLLGVAAVLMTSTAWSTPVSFFRDPIDIVFPSTVFPNIRSTRRRPSRSTCRRRASRGGRLRGARARARHLSDAQDGIVDVSYFSSVIL